MIVYNDNDDSYADKINCIVFVLNIIRKQIRKNLKRKLRKLLLLNAACVYVLCIYCEFIYIYINIFNPLKII